ncbi:MAG TPA: UDP-N-acetylmuramoyl-tripeptide--D-alanyl-D-alanine ligase [Actinomycetota bacterium]|nr:UDP-N-acetylmuramoyl-tripeptide--D-alanyl-D-alanine ligase [Actinomycetota bacterium]
MMPRALSAIAREVDGRLEGPDADVTQVVIDSRDARPGALFVALPGERTDGSRFVADAFAEGAVGVIVADATSAPGPAIEVASTGEALLRLGSAERHHIPACVGITGANGKTSTKDMTAAVLGTRMRAHASPGSFNNEIGLPMTLLGAPSGTEVVVAELGARRKGDVAMLCEVARPEVVVVTNVGVAHLEIFGSWDAIVEASAEPVDSVPSSGWAVLNADDRVVAGYRSRCPGRVMTFGVHAAADVRATGVSIGSDGAASFTLHVGGESASVTLRVPGEHMVPNALAAAAVGSILGVPIQDAAEAAGVATISRWRMETFTTADGVRVINDAYNANPESMAAALKAARIMARRSRLIAVLGHMAELGPIAVEQHERLGELAARLPVDRLIVFGEAAEPIAVAGLREGVEPANVAAYHDASAVLDDLRHHAVRGDVILFKGSRVAGLETLAEALR